MPSSGYFDATFGGHPYTLRLNLAVASQDISANQSTVNWNLQIISVPGYYPSRSDSAPTWYYNGASGHFGPFSFTTAGGQVLTIASGTFVVTHASDGTYTLSNSFNANAMTTITTASGSGSMALPTIPRATQPTVSPTSGNTDSTYAIGTVPASSGFYHDIYYSLDGGTTLVSIVSNQVGTTTSTNWTPASSLLPNSTSVTAIISVDTRNSSGGTIIGTKTVSLPLTVPTTVVPTISGVTWTDVQTSSPDIPTLMGGSGRFVQKWSKLDPTVASAGAYSSTIVGSAVSQGGQVTASGTAFSLPISLSGSVSYSAVVTDSRARSSDPYTGTVAVTAYNFPSLPTPTVTRTSDSAGAIPSPTGTYLAITPLASVSSLLFATVEKNLLEWQVRTRPVGGSWTTISAWSSATVSGNTWTTKYVAAGPYLSSLEYEVEVSIRDLFGKNGYNTGSTIVVLTVPVPSESVFMDWDGTTGIGLGQYRSNGMLDVAGNIYQGGNLVLDTSDFATDAQAIAGTSTAVAVTPHALAAVVASTTQAGLVPLSTDAQAVTGTDTTHAVTPHALSAKLALPVQGQVPSSVVVGSGTASVAADGTITFTGCSSVSLNGIFDGLGADMYQWYMSPQSSISVVNILARFRAAGTDLASTSYGATYHGYSGGVAGSQTAGTTLSALYAGYALNTANLVSCSFGIINKPKTATYKTMQSLEYSPNYVNYDMGSYTTSLTLYDGITFFVTSGTISGQVKIVKVA